MTARPDEPSSLADWLAGGRRRAAVTFAGQGVDAFAELRMAVAARPELRDLVAAGGATLAALVERPDLQATGRYRHGLDVAGWLAAPDVAPDPAYLRSSAVSHPLILLTQVVAWQAAWLDGLEAAWKGGVVAVTGHSQGLLAALAVAEAGGGPVGTELLARYLELAVRQGAAMVPAPTAGGATPMAAVTGVWPDRLAAVLDAVHASLPPEQHVVVGLRNGPARHVLSGPPAVLAMVREELDRQARREAEERREGRRGGAPLRPTWTPLDVDAAFHWPGQRDAMARFLDTAAALFPAPGELAVPVLCPARAVDLREVDDLPAAVAAGQFVEPVRWDATTRALADLDVDWVLDLGPGTDTARFTREALRGSGVRVLGLASPEGQRILFVPGAAPAEPDVRYDDVAPRLVELPDGRRHVDTRYTRLTARPPVVLAGMTPTTVDAGIVAAAANAGFTAELAGGGQRTADVLTARLEELEELLVPGTEVVFNTLLLDRPLWDLHLGARELVLRARRAGAPLVGVTVSAGVPDVEEAVAWLDRWRAHGLVLNAFKPGTEDQLRQVLAIADAAPHHPVVVHVEGGKGGGHHSWDDLDDLLLAGYHELRLRRNVVLVAGGGVATPERAADLLTGTWSRRYGLAPMPVDAVLVGTAAMACAEATASPQVKEALVAARGTGGWVARRAADGGVTSGRSHLDADIHCLDNAASRTGHLLDEVAGDPAAAAARHDEIVTALAGTARPWFGDLAAMTYGEVLDRFVALCATGRHRRYDDGAWGDPTWRERALALFVRFAARLAGADDGPVAVPVGRPADLDDPAAALARFRAALPAAETTRLHPADAQWFLEVCDRKGKPLPFVPVIDAEVRRWFMADALWQAQDERYDADGVLVIPGPASVAGIERVDEPVAELLARFEQATVARLEAAGVAPARRDRLSTGGAAPRELADVAADRSGPVAALCVAPTVWRPRPGDGRLAGRANPLWSLVAPGDAVTGRTDPTGRLVAVEVRPAGAGAERVELREDGDGVAVVVHLGDDDGDVVVHRARPLVPAPASGPAFAWDEPADAHDTDDTADTARASARLLAGPDAAPADDPFAGETASWTCDEERVAAYRSTTGARHGGVPLDLAFTLAWPALVRVVTAAELRAGLERLLHQEHRVTPGPAWPPRAGETGTAEAVLRDLDDGAERRRFDVEVVLQSPRGELARVHGRFLVPGAFGATPFARRRRWRDEVELAPLDSAAAELLGEQPWLVPVDGAPPPAPGDRLVAVVDLGADHPRSGPARYRAVGTLHRDGAVVARIALDREGTEADHPVAAVLAVLAAPAAAPEPRPPRRLAESRDTAPATMAAFARVGGDRNPLHRSHLAARLAGLAAPIVHGVWVAARAEAFVADAVAGGHADRLRDWSVQFLAPVPLGAPLELEATRRAAAEGGCTRVEVAVTTGGVAVARADALVAPPPTALVFPGQGAQRQGMGGAGRARSQATARVWAEADAFTAAAFGFSLVDVVTRNPVALRLPTGEVRHPGGVLARTEMTQVALLTVALGQLAELRDRHALPEGFAAAGHSVGEYAALAALGVLPAEAAWELVYRRGLAMQRHVTRDERGASPYRLGVADPSAVGLDADALHAVVAEVAEATGRPLEVVNHNLRGRQYGVVGTADALAALDERLARHGRRTGGARPLRLVDGIDIPFHSRLLAPAVAELREHLVRLVPPVDPARLEGRWVPNLLGRPFSVAPDVVAEVAACTGAALDPDAPDATALVVELLAHQLAAPVRWVETHDWLVAPAEAGGFGAARIVELGPEGAPVLVHLAAAALEGPSRPVALWHLERDLDQVLGTDEPDPDDPDDPDEPGAEAEAALAAPVQPVAPVAAAAGPVDRAAPDAAAALLAVLALQARVRRDQLRPDETLDELFQGVSSRRNQVLIDLGRELGLAAGDGVIDVPLGQMLEELPARVPRYRFPGPYLRDAVTAGLQRLLGPAGWRRRDGEAHLRDRWGFGPGLVEHALLTLAVDGRDGESVRGGPLARVEAVPAADPAAARRLLDAVAALVAADLDVAVAPQAPLAPPAPAPAEAPTVAAPPEPPGAVDDEAAPVVAHPSDVVPDLERLALLDAELGAQRADEVRPLFDARRHVAMTASWGTVRWDLVTCFHDALAGRRTGAALDAEIDRLALHAGDRSLARTASWLAGRAEAAGRPDVAAALRRAAQPRRTPLLPAGVRPVTEVGPGGELRWADRPAGPERLEALFDDLDGDPAAARAAWTAALHESRREAPERRGEVALLTGASPGSIAAEVARQLLRAGATVVVATSTLTPERRRWYRRLYREAAAPGAALHLVPANLASFGDIDALVAWLTGPTGPGRPTLLFPFAATATSGDAATAGPGWEAALRLQVLGVERLLTAVALAGPDVPDRAPLTAVLPLSPNHGDLGGDGPYGETKAALEVLLARRRSEHAAWGRRVAMVGARIGWVRGTGLMGANDLVAAAVEDRLGVRTFSAAEAGWLLAALAAPEVRALAADDPVTVSLTGGLDRLGSWRDAVADLAAELAGEVTHRRCRRGLDEALAARLGRDRDAATPLEVPALPAPSPPPAAPAVWPEPDLPVDPAELVVIVGAADLGPCGTGLTRFELERDGLTPAGVAEAAWLCGLIEYRREGYRGRWVDTATGQEVPEEELFARYRDEVVGRLGVRPLDGDGVVDPRGLDVLAPVHLTAPFTFEVATEAEARAHLAADPARTRIRPSAAGDGWLVTLSAGAAVRVPRLAPHGRRVAGQLPTGFDPSRWGLPADLLATADRLAMVNLVCTAEAFLDAGLEPEELLAALHPAAVANTQGAGMGGMASLRRLLLDHLLDQPRQGDRLQESLGNVVAAHVVQAYIGSYGPMVHPVAACATAAVSLEEAYDKIRAGKALAVVAGGFDDLTPEGLVGFGDLHATAASDELDAMGIAPEEASRPNDARRRGFVEAQGGGTFVVVRGDVALALGLPVRAVLAYAASFGDGLQSSIPAPGMGLLACGAGGAGSPLSRALGRLGLAADDIAVVSKHDTATELNDPNEADLHQRLQDALGRTPGNPLLVVSQKAVTGHAKGGAAAWQVHGVLQVMEHGVVPGNPHLEAVDPRLAPFTHLAHGDRPIVLAPGERVRAALVTSLGFGHVSAVVALAHPDVFLAAVPAEARAGYVAAAAARRRDGIQRRLAIRHGEPVALRNRLPGGILPRDDEAARLLAAGP